MKERIGIITFWGVPNYGAWAQAYALSNLVREVVGNSKQVEHIAYLHTTHYQLYYKKDERLYNSFNYSYQLIPHTDHMNGEQLEKEKFDVIISGSDTVWEFNNKSMGSDYRLIGNGLNAKKLVSYAPSCGTTTIDTEVEEGFAKGISKYEYITVRDDNSADVIQKYTGTRPEIVLDPTLLWNFNKDQNVIMPTYESYIAVYGMYWDEEFIKEAVAFAKEKGCKLISIGYINDWCDMSLRMIELRGLEWIGMIKNASYVLTSTFHGFMLSIAFNKQFKFNRLPYVEKRSETLLRELQGGMEVYLIDRFNFERIFKEELDYEVINIHLSELRKKSMRCLKEMLEDKK